MLLSKATYKWRYKKLYKKLTINYIEGNHYSDSVRGGRFGGMLGIVVLLEYPTSPKLQLCHWLYDIYTQDLVVVNWIHDTLHTLEIPCTWRSKTAPEHNWPPAMLHSRKGVLFSIGLVLPPPGISLIQRPKELQFCIPKPLWFLAYWSRLFLCFGVSRGVRLGVLAWRPSSRSVCLIVWAETWVPHSNNSCRSSSAVTPGFFSTFRFRYRRAVADSILFLPRPGSVSTVPLALNLRIMLPILSLEMFNVLAIFLYPYISLWREITSSLDSFDHSLDFTMLQRHH